MSANNTRYELSATTRPTCTTWRNFVESVIGEGAYSCADGVRPLGGITPVTAPTT
jgi:hypothetical protein